MNGDVSLAITLAGIELKTPLLVCSGTFGSGKEYSQWMELPRLGAIITKSVTEEARRGNPPPRLWETHAGMLNSIGLENPGVERFIQNDLAWLAGTGVPVIVSVAGATVEEYARVAERVSAASHVRGLELNVSCPNVKNEGLDFGSDRKTAAAVVGAVKAASGLPVFAKLSAFCGDLAGIVEAVAAAGADGLSLINTLPAMAIDVATGRPRLGAVRGGLSGPAILPVALRCVWEAARRVDIPIIGMGGVHDLDSLLQMLLAGAAAVAVGTANFTQPDIAVRLTEQLAACMAENGWASIRDLMERRREEA
ncbi:MAG: dihydroorotate dehydrogenase [Candidatus Geothermincolia bacterium]